MQHNVLFVDDESAVTEGLKRTLYAEPFQILTARSAKEALHILKTESIDVVVSDEEMPGLGGLDFLTLVWEKYPDTIRMLLTGKANLGLTIRAINEGNLYRFFTKPCDEVDLATTIRQALKQKELEAETKRLQILATQDGLTKIANRRYFDLSIEEEWTRAQPNHYPISLLIADIDYFKPYNDHYGHQAGEECLEKIAASIKKFARRKGDLVARYGGEEFVIILSGMDQDTSGIMAEKIRASVESLKIPHAHSDVSDVVTISIGTATMKPDAGLSHKNLIANADKALDKAKSQGRNRVSQFAKTA